ncbi:hypothetical protein I6A84_37565 [Frankia sp. CNm7]|uniref:Uncharacterized protein n=1 Tax=Frankia nepalensis TaxID=1836974 RepID=A0A937UNC2_9ACTN|nr:hypothetical protein [Frankia nepalensis]MBL7496982.1 hypothetical protein [Frankia nepalensis]MBL7511317.1 hypothetical protein [Frankia nepalensis]MBL7523605.1 hypothetical protein [Frankia nepalensis]MBL7626085.1 hypothetical protein [Frankia nepalensis]
MSVHLVVLLLLAFALIFAVGLAAALVAAWLTHADGASTTSAIRAGGRTFVAVCMLSFAAITTLAAALSL